MYACAVLALPLSANTRVTLPGSTVGLYLREIAFADFAVNQWVAKAGEVSVTLARPLGA